MSKRYAAIVFAPLLMVFTGCTKEMICEMVSECGFSPAPMERTIFVSQSEINDHFGSVYIRQGLTATRVCEELGYGECIAGQYFSETTYYSSTDLTCSGDKQLEDEESTLLPCHFPENISQQCGHKIVGYTEPIFGDADGYRILSGALCTSGTNTGN